MTLLAGLDLETTGFKQEKGHRIVEVCIQLWDAERQTLVRDYTQRINPLRDIPEDAARVHGIRLEDLHNAPTWEKVAPIVNAFLSKAKCLVIHNAEFDAPFLGMELLRVGITPADVQTFCTMKNARWATANGRNPKLAQLCWSLGVDFNPNEAHAASYDVQKMMEALWAGVNAGRFTLPI